VIRQTTFVRPESDPKWTVKDSPPQAVSCPACKHVYMIHSLQQKSLEVTEEQWAVLQTTLVEFPIRVQCDEPGCDIPLIILVIRTSGTTREDIAKERLTWKPHDLVCPGGYPVSKV
jgi:hypothetical protein